jgi:PAS domain S-box-containing protein
MNEQSTPSKGNILVVDDTPDTLELLATILSLAGYTVRTAPSGRLALTSIQSILPDLILLDIMMPQMDGYEVCQRLKASPTSKDIPVIFISALNEVFDKVKAFEVGGVDYIPKPFQEQEVVARVENQLRLQRLSKQLQEQNVRLQQEIKVRKQTEEVLRQSRQLLGSVLNSSLDGIMAFRTLRDSQGNIVDFVWLLVNPAAEKIIGRTANELVGKDLLEVLPGHRTAGLFDSYIQVVETGVALETECYYEHDGIKAWFQIAAVKLGNGFAATFRDISDRKIAETALRESEQRWQLAIQGINSGIWDRNLKTGEIFHSARWKEILGYEDYEIENTGEEWDSRLHPDDAGWVRDAYQAHLEKKTPYYIAEYRLQCKDGSYKWIRSRGLALWDELGNPVRIVGAHEDITDRKQAELALKLANERLQYLLTSTPAIIFSMKLGGDYELTFMSENVLAIFGYEAREFLEDANFWDSHIHPEDSERIHATLPQLSQKESDFQEYRFLHADGTYRWVFDRLRVVKDVQGNPIECVGYWIDISDRKIAEEKLRHREAQLDTIVTNISDGILILDPRSRVLFANPAASALLNVPVEDLIDYQWGIPVGQTAEIDLVCSQGENRVAEMRVAQAQWLGRLAYIVALRDISDRKHAEEALRVSEAREREKAKALELALDDLKRTQAQVIQTEKMSSLGRMVAGIAHEINNPVGFIQGNLTHASHYFQDLLSLLERYQQTYPNPTPAIQQFAEEIDLNFVVQDWQKLMTSMQVGAERIYQIVLSLRNFSRLDEKQLKSVDIHEGIDNTLLILQHRLRRQGNTTEIQVIKGYGQLPKVTCYASQLNQVFLNLLSNAIDALEQDSKFGSTKPGVIPTITIRTSVNTKDWELRRDSSTTPKSSQVLLSNREFVVIRIADNGLGMSEQVLCQIFDPFFTTKPVGSGTGLGLSISYQIVVEKHKGHISCVSAPGQGTEFIVEIPVGHTNDQN